MTKKPISKRTRGRLGRPPQDLAGEVESRILDAAQRVFLEKGYPGASMDEIAELAPASKPTIYSHFPGKETLFAAVVDRVINGLTSFESYAPGGRTVQDRLTNLGTELVERFIKDTVGVARVMIAEAERFPQLSRHLHEASRDRAANAVSYLLNEATDTLSRSSKGPFDNNRRIATAQIFMDLILLPMLMRALMGDDAKVLRRELPSFVRDRVNFFLTACERGWPRR
jgi:AcrR family transcriptional regulator